MNIFITDGEKNTDLLLFFRILLRSSSSSPSLFSFRRSDVITKCKIQMYRDNASDRDETASVKCVRISDFEFMIRWLGRAGRVPCSKREEPVSSSKQLVKS